MFPQSVFTKDQLIPKLETVLPDGRITLNVEDGNHVENVPLVSLTLLGRNTIKMVQHHSIGVHKFTLIA